MYCPFANNTYCCETGGAIHEITYHNNNYMPSGVSELLSYYTDGSYPTSTSTAYPTPPSQNSISAGAGIGIGVGATVIACAAALGFCLFARRAIRRRRARRQGVIMVTSRHKGPSTATPRYTAGPIPRGTGAESRQREKAHEMPPLTPSTPSK